MEIRDRDQDHHDASPGFEELVEQVRNGSDSAMWELLLRYEKNILRSVQRHLPAEIRQKVDSTDIVQSVWRSLLRMGTGLGQADSAERFIAYLAGMARNKVFEAHRHFNQQAYDVRREVPWDLAERDGKSDDPRDAHDFIDKTCPQPSAIVEAQDNWERAMSKAGERGHEVVQLRLQGLSLEEVSVRLNISKRTVQRVLDTMLQSLRI